MRKPHFKKWWIPGVQCDGLVISGHHTGSFGGKNALSNLKIDFMEKLSCDPKNEKFFTSIKALWLQGCRTLGVGKIETYDTADFHTDRVGAVLQEDHLTQSFAELNLEFSATLDQDNPLSSRYLRVFPRATTFGWTKTAPGVKAKSELSIPFHIAHIAYLNDDRKIYFDDPSNELSNESAVKYSAAILDILGNTGIQTKECSAVRDEQKFVNAWKEHGTPKQGNKYYFDNPDLNAYPSIFHSDNLQLKRAKEIDCLLKNIHDPEKLMSVLDEILKEDAIIGYNFNSIYELMQRLQKEGNIEALVTLRKRLTESQNLNQFLMKKMASPELGILRRIDYYAFWKSMTNTSNAQIEKKIQNSYIELMLKKVRENDYSAIDFKKTLSQSLSAHGLLNGEILKSIVNSPKTDNESLMAVASVIGNSKTPIDGASEMLKSIVISPKSNSDILEAVTNVIGDSKTPIDGASEMLKSIVNSSKADRDILEAVAKVIGGSKIPIEGASEMLQSIVNSSKANEFSLIWVANAIRDSKTPIEGASEILKSIVNSPKVNGYSLNSVVNAIGDSRTPIEGSSEILQLIEKSAKLK